MITLPRSHPQSPFGLKSLATSWLFLAILGPISATAADPPRSPHRHIPAKNLIAYFEFDGLDAHDAAWRRTSAHAALSETKAGAMIGELAKQVTDWVIAEYVPVLTGADARALHDHIVRRGFTVAVHGFGPEAFSEMYVLNDFKGADLITCRKNLKRLVNFVGLPRPISLRGRQLYEFDENDEPAQGKDNAAAVSYFLGLKPAKDHAENATSPWLTAWFEDDDLIIVWGLSEDAGDKADPASGKSLAQLNRDFITSILDTADGKQANVSAHAGYKAAVDERNALRGFEPAALFFIGPGDDAGILTAFLKIGEDPKAAPAAQRSPSSPTSPHTSVARPPLVDDEIRKVNAETESLPPVFTDEDLEFLKLDRASAKPMGKVEPPARQQAGDDEGPDFTKAEISALGLDNLKRIVGRLGFQGEAFLTDIRVDAPSPRKRLNAGFDQPMFRKSHLPPMPHGVVSFAAGSLDIDNIYQRILESSKSVDGPFDDFLLTLEETAHDLAHVRLREDLLQNLGPTWCLYQFPARPLDREPKDNLDPTAYVLLVGVKDASAFGKVLDGVASFVNDSEGFLNFKEASFLEKLSAPDVGYRMSSPAAAKLELDTGVQPAIVVGKSFIAVAATPELARDALNMEKHNDKRWKPTGKLAGAFEGLPDDLTFLAVSDHRESSFPDKIAGLPTMIQTLINMSQEENLDNASPWCILDIFGLPRPGGFQVKIPRSQVQTADDVRPFFMPSILAATVDQRGYRLISREAFPLALLANESLLKFYVGFQWTLEEGLRFQEQANFMIFGFDPTELP